MYTEQPIDGSKEDFRKYLDRKGVMDAITKVLIKCNSDRPENAIEFLLENLGEKVKDKHIIACLETDLAEARNEIETLKRKVEALQISAAAASTPSAGISNGSSPAEDGALSDSVASEEAATDKETKVAPVAAGTGVSQEASGDATGEPSEPVSKEQAAQ